MISLSRHALGLVLTLASLPALSAQESSSRLIRGLADEVVARAQRGFEKATDFAEDHSSWENAWQVKSEHYVVRTTQSYAYAKSAAQGLETMLGYYQKLLQTDFEPAERFQVFILPDIAAYREFGNSNGAHHSSIHGSYYARDHAQRPVATFFDPNPVLVNMQLTHAAVHQFVEQAFGRAPITWVDEGLASYFALFWANDWGVQELQRLQVEKRFHPLDRSLRTTIERYGVDTAQDRFLQLGMFFTYLLIWREDTKTVYDESGEVSAPFATLLRRSVRGERVTDLPVNALLTQKLSEIEADFKAYEFPLKGR